MRLFIALDLDNEYYFKEMQKQLPEATATYPSKFHLTLKFLGETDKKQEIIEKLKQAKLQEFTLKTTNIGVFPNENFIKVVWLGLENNEILTKLQKDIEESLAEFNFKKDYNDFIPHITLARIKFLSSAQDYMTKLKQITIKEKEFKITSFKLISSELAKEGPVYKDLASFS